MESFRPKWYSNRNRSRMSSVEYKVAQALADKEGIEQKRKLAIAEEAEKKRKRMAANGHSSGQAMTDFVREVHEVFDEKEEEEKYVGPRLHDGAIPEMIVGSGALGMTAPKKQRVTVQRVGKRYKRVEDEDPDWSLTDALKPSTSSFRRFPKAETPMGGSVNDNLLRAIESHIPRERFDSSIADDIESDEDEQKRFRYREIGRIICEMNLKDFPHDIDRSSRNVAHRGDEILASIKRNLTVIRDRLGEHAKGTIFDHVDELTNYFAEVTPKGLARLSESVTEKINRKEATIAGALAGISEMREVKQEEVDVKLEEPEYMDNYEF